MTARPDRSVKRLHPDRRKNMVDELARLVRLAFQAGVTASLWGLEGPLRASLRADLCRKSWNWHDADAATRALLEGVFARAGAERPSWYEGQPEWNIEPGTLIERTRCANCHKPLPEGRPKFCSNLCGSNHSHRIVRRKEAGEDMATTLAIRSA